MPKGWQIARKTRLKLYFSNDKTKDTYRNTRSRQQFVITQDDVSHPKMTMKEDDASHSCRI